MRQRARANNESRTGLVSLFLLVIIGIALLALLLLVSPGRAFARLSGEQAVSLHSPLFADYSVDPRILLPQINLKVVEDTIRDQATGKQPEQELTKVVNSLKTPVPTALPYFTPTFPPLPTSTLTKPGLVWTHTPPAGNTDKTLTPTLPSLITLTPSRTQHTPTGMVNQTKTATGTSPTATLSPTSWWWPTQTEPVPTFATWTPTSSATWTPLPTYTNTPVPSHTPTPTSSNTPTGTPTRTPTNTPTRTHTPTYTSTPTPTPVPYPPPVTPYP